MVFFHLFTFNFFVNLSRYLKHIQQKSTHFKDIYKIYMCGSRGGGVRIPGKFKFIKFTVKFQKTLRTPHPRSNKITHRNPHPLDPPIKCVCTHQWIGRPRRCRCRHSYLSRGTGDNGTPPGCQSDRYSDQKSLHHYPQL